MARFTDSDYGFSIIGSDSDTGQGSPIDSRFVFTTVEDALKSIPVGNRYPGLKVYIVSEHKEYMFWGGTTDAKFTDSSPSKPITLYVAGVYSSNDLLYEVPSVAKKPGTEAYVIEGEYQSTVKEYQSDGTNWTKQVDPVIDVVCVSSITDADVKARLGEVYDSPVSGKTVLIVKVPKWGNLKSYACYVYDGSVWAKNTTVKVSGTLAGLSDGVANQTGYVVTTTLGPKEGINAIIGKYVWTGVAWETSPWAATSVNTLEVPFEIPQAGQTSNINEEHGVTVTSSSSTTVVTIPHNLGSRYVDVTIYDDNDQDASDGLRGPKIYAATDCITLGNGYAVEVSFEQAQASLAGQKFIAVFQK